MAALASAAVPSFDVTLQSVTMDNLPIVTAITGYDSSEANILSTNQYPLMAPYTSFTDAWWDNLVSEQLQARLPVIFLSTCGSYNTNPACLTGPGNMNAYRLKSYIDALNRAGAGGKVKIGCFAEAAAQAIYMNYYGLPSNTLVDFSNTDSWNEVWWQRIVKPWFDTVPSSYWYTIGGKVPVEFWGLNITSIYTNQQGNISQLFNYLATQIYNTYGVYPFFIMGSLNCDTTLASCSYMLADNQWFSPPSTPYTVTTYKGFTCVGMVAGYTNSGYNTVGSSAYHNANGGHPPQRGGRDGRQRRHDAGRPRRRGEQQCPADDHRRLHRHQRKLRPLPFPRSRLGLSRPIPQHPAFLYRPADRHPAARRGGLRRILRYHDRQFGRRVPARGRPRRAADHRAAGDLGQQPGRDLRRGQRLRRLDRQQMAGPHARAGMDRVRLRRAEPGRRHRVHPDQRVRLP